MTTGAVPAATASAAALPVQLTSLVGREREVASVRRTTLLPSAETV